MTKRKLLQPNVIYLRALDPTSLLNASLDLKGGVINVYNFNKVSLSQKPPINKDDMTLDYISPLDVEDTYSVDTISDFFLYEVVSGNPRVVGLNLIA